MDLDLDVTEDEILRWMSCANAIPLPSYYTPTGGVPLQDIDDDVLLTAPPHLIAHVQRTAAQGGMQVISPRQTAFSSLMLRTRGGTRDIGDHVVGVVAMPDAVWPTIDDMDFSGLIPDQPLPPRKTEVTARPKTKTLPLTAASRHLSDPILSCLVKGRAVIDLLRREDVMGGADELTEVLAAAWGIPKSDLDDLDAFTLGVAGSLQRHAIKTDEVFPTTYAPVHIRRSISVGASDVSKNYLPDDTAMDWRRMRTHCEAVFILSCSIEAFPLQLMTAFPPPGDPGARSDRPNVMVFQPAPASAWSYSGTSFCVHPNRPPKSMRCSAIPREVMEALARYTKVVRPLSYAMSAGLGPRARKSIMLTSDTPLGESIANSYKMMVRGLVVASARGRTAAATIRNLIFETLESTSLLNRMRIVRYIMLANDECRTHLSLNVVPELVVDRLATRFLTIGDEIRRKVVAEAARRGHTAEEWWSDILAQAPERYAGFVEGTMGWATVALWLMFRSPTDRWRKLVSAVHYSALREAECNAIGGLALPPEKGSKDRLLAACSAVVKKVTKVYASYYMGVADVGMAVAEEAKRMGRPRTSDTLQEAAFLWVLRARAFRGTNVSLRGKKELRESENHYRVEAMPANVIIVPAPYRAFEAYRSHAETSTILTKTFKKYLSEFQGVVISDCFAHWSQPLAPVKKSTLTLYVCSPYELGYDMERSWQMLKDDVRATAMKYGSSERSRSASPDAKRMKSITSTVFEMPAPVSLEENLDYFTVLALMDEDSVEWVEDLMEKMGPTFEENVMAMTWPNVASMRSYLVRVASENNPLDVEELEVIH